MWRTHCCEADTRNQTRSGREGENEDSSDYFQQHCKSGLHTAVNLTLVMKLGVMEGKIMKILMSVLNRVTV